jgi:HK97 family phage major capsid protein
VTDNADMAVRHALGIMVRIAGEAGSKEMTRPQHADYTAARETLLSNLSRSSSAYLRDIGSAMRAVVDGAATAGREITPNEERFLEEVDRLVTLEDRANDNQELRAKIEPLLSVRGTSTTGTSSISTLWEQYEATNRTSGFSATIDVELSAPYMQSRALSTSADAFPSTFADSVTVYERTATPMLDPNVVTISTSRSGAGFVIPRLTSDISVGGTVTAENAAITEVDPTISSVTLTPYKFAAISLWSAELDQDNVIEIEDLIAQSQGRELGLDIGTALTTADGSSKPQGFIGVASNGGTASKAFGGTATTFFDYGDLVGLWGSLAAPYRSVGVWQVSTDALVKISRFRDNDGNLLLLPGIGGSQPTIMGRPVYENPAMAAVASASKSVAFGDFKQYWVRRVTPVRVELSRDWKFNTDQVALKTVDRIDGDLIDTTAIKYLVSAST